MLRRTWMAMPLLGLAVAMAAGCDETATGIGDGTGPIEISMAQSSSAAAGADVTIQDDESGDFAIVPLTTFTSITVTVAEVHVLPNDADENEESSWIRLQPVEAGATIDLLALPSDDDGGVLLARGEVPVGSYHNVRILFTEARVTLDQTIELGNRTILSGSHELHIPSGAQTGIKIPGATFSVEESDTEEITHVFDASASVQTIVAVGPPTETRLQMSPVLTVR